MGSAARQVIDTALLFVIGQANRVVFAASHGRVVLYRFGGTPAVLLTIDGPSAPLGETMFVSHLRDGDHYIVLATEAEGGVLTALRGATTTAVEHANQQIPVDVTILADAADRAALRARLLKHASIDERNEVRRQRKVPIARLTPHHKPAPGTSEARSAG